MHPGIAALVGIKLLSTMFLEVRGFFFGTSAVSYDQTNTHIAEAFRRPVYA